MAAEDGSTPTFKFDIDAAARGLIANLPGADLPVTFPSGETRSVNMIVMLAETQMSEQMARFGHCQAQNMRTIAELVEKYELDWFASEVFPRGVVTWEQCAEAMRHVYTYFDDHIKSQRVS